MASGERDGKGNEFVVGGREEARDEMVTRERERDDVTSNDDETVRR
jgi:hypothetical protein